jgi:hypothetical protein
MGPPDHLEIFNELVITTEYFYKSLCINITKTWGLLIKLLLLGLKNPYDLSLLGIPKEISMPQVRGLGSVSSLIFEFSNQPSPR